MTKLSKTDTIIQDEQNQILKNRHQLIVGKKYKYKDLTEVLRIRYLDGKAKINQVKRIKEYIEWGQDFIIRDNNIDIDELNGGGVKRIKNKYTEHAKGIITYKLARNYLKNPKMEQVTLSRSKAIELMDLFSESFILAVKSGHEVVGEVLGIETKQVRQYMSFVRGKAIDIFESTCKDLEKRDIIVMKNETIVRREWSVPQYVIQDNGTDEDVMVALNCYAIEQDIKDIKSFEKEVLQEMGIKSHFQATAFGRYTELKRRVCKKLKIEAYWKAYDIYLNPDMADKIVQEYRSRLGELVENLKIEFIQSIMDSNAKTLKLAAINNKELLERLCKIFIFGDKDFNDNVQTVIERNIRLNQYQQQKSNLHLEQENKINISIDNKNFQETDELKSLLKELYNIDLESIQEQNDDELEYLYQEGIDEDVYIEEMESQIQLEDCPYRDKQEEQLGIEGLSSKECPYYQKWKREEEGLGMFNDIFNPSECPHLNKKEELGVEMDEEYTHECPHLIKNKDENRETELYSDEIRQYILNEYRSELEL